MAAVRGTVIHRSFSHTAVCRPDGFESFAARRRSALLLVPEA